MNVQKTVQSVPIIVVEVANNPKTSLGVENSKEDLSIWNNCICSEFPIINKTIMKKQAICEVGSPHLGYTIKASVKNGLLEGNATIEDPSGITVARLTYEKGIENGKCTLYYKSGKVYFEGYFQNGYRSGIGKEFSEEGDVIYDGFYRNGIREAHIVKRNDRCEYWNEFDDLRRLVSVCSKDDLGRNDGICYFYSNGEISYISRWNHGEEKEILHVFEGDTMTSYKKGKVVYEGKYTKKSDFEFCPYIPVQSVQHDSESKERKKQTKIKKYFNNSGEACLEDWKCFEYFCISLMIIILTITFIWEKESLRDVILILLFAFLFCNSLALFIFLVAKCVDCYDGL